MVARSLYTEDTPNAYHNETVPFFCQEINTVYQFLVLASLSQQVAKSTNCLFTVSKGEGQSKEEILLWMSCSNKRWTSEKCCNESNFKGIVWVFVRPFCCLRGIQYQKQFSHWACFLFHQPVREGIPWKLWAFQFAKTAKFSLKTSTPSLTCCGWFCPSPIVL